MYYIYNKYNDDDSIKMWNVFFLQMCQKVSLQSDAAWINKCGHLLNGTYEFI